MNVKIPFIPNEPSVVASVRTEKNVSFTLQIQRLTVLFKPKVEYSKFNPKDKVDTFIDEKKMLMFDFLITMNMVNLMPCGIKFILKSYRHLQIRTTMSYVRGVNVFMQLSLTSYKDRVAG